MVYIQVLGRRNASSDQSGKRALPRPMLTPQAQAQAEKERENAMQRSKKSKAGK